MADSTLSLPESKRRAERSGSRQSNSARRWLWFSGTTGIEGIFAAESTTIESKSEREESDINNNMLCQSVSLLPWRHVTLSHDFHQRTCPGKLTSRDFVLLCSLRKNSLCKTVSWFRNHNLVEIFFEIQECFYSLKPQRGNWNQQRSNTIVTANKLHPDTVCPGLTSDFAWIHEEAEVKLNLWPTTFTVTCTVGTQLVMNNWEILQNKHYINQLLPKLTVAEKAT